MIVLHKLTFTVEITADSLNGAFDAYEELIDAAIGISNNYERTNALVMEPEVSTIEKPVDN